MDRINSLCSFIEACETFADVGCDHGFCTQYALKNGLCKSAIIADVSSQSLKKAQKLLKEYIECGRCRAVCCDGLTSIPHDTEEVMIAGMGGYEIIKILKQGFIPKKFILQPMKNLRMVREFLIDSGCKITYDGVFYDGKYYFLIKGERSGTTSGYTEEELYFGRDSIKSPLFKEFAKSELEKKQSYIKGGRGSKEILRELELLKRFV